MSGKKVIVVGAGCAGLMAAHTLRKQGVDVIVLEASEFIGGVSLSNKTRGVILCFWINGLSMQN